MATPRARPEYGYYQRLLARRAKPPTSSSDIKTEAPRSV
jgi:hypothetical protein